jgi:23S rRNA (cytidine1920-2'-O)/16S rRNA (cytidine1409-2'-O)-methyltransferase
MRQRLDHALIAANLADSRARAQALVKAGVVLVDGEPARKASQTIPPGTVLTLTENPCPWVSRSALKLVHALDLWGLTPHGEALDVGASTGGFTEVLLARGAARVHALDVGHGQLHYRLASDRRVRNLEGLNAKDIPDDLIPPLDWIVSDVSFISLEKALPKPLSLAKPSAILVALIKPQFEVGRGFVGRGGLVKDPELHTEVRANIAAFLTAEGWQVTGEADSPVTGGDGNQEFLIAARKSF